ncbi:MAG: uroporphyrinogen-III synthase [Pseudomonadota bacterium]
MGFEPLKVPLTELSAVPTRTSIPTEIQDIDFVVVTSANAARFATPDIIEAIVQSPVYAVGDATAAACRLAGLKHVYSVNGDAHALLAELASQRSAGEEALYLCGQLRRPTIELGLQRLNIEAVVAETYATVKVSQLTDKLDFAFGGLPFGAAMLFSSFSAQIFREDVIPTLAPQHHENTPLFVISERAAQEVDDSWGGPIIIAKEMRADVMHETVRSHFFPDKA